MLVLRRRAEWSEAHHFAASWSFDHASASPRSEQTARRSEPDRDEKLQQPVVFHLGIRSLRDREAPKVAISEDFQPSLQVEC